MPPLTDLALSIVAIVVAIAIACRKDEYAGWRR